MFVPAYHWVALRFVADNRKTFGSNGLYRFLEARKFADPSSFLFWTAGVWAFHCHTAWHMASGLLMQFVSMPAETKLLPIPPEMLDQCRRQRVPVIESTPSK